MRQPKGELTNDRVVLKMLELLRLQGKTEKELISSIGLANGTFSKWKFHEMKSYRLYLKEIAEFLDVTVEYLLEGTDEVLTMETLKPSEIWLMRLYRKMDSEQKNIILKTAEYFAKSIELNGKIKQ